RLQAFSNAAADGKWKLAEFSRANVIQVLSIISETLLPELKIMKPVDDDLVVDMGHPATDILLELIDALRDLDDGKQHAVLTAAKVRNARNPRWQRKQDKALDEAVLIMAKKDEDPIEKAQKKVAETLNRKKWLRRGKKVTTGTLRRIRNTAAKKG
ncbi:hypothetical protein, partial [Aestuariivirga sp.]|uniref:hypothetical protein n=1 Tax=Aestuariivirga sp. TaxID=2650926 RepID=UPI00301AA59F